MHYHKIKTNNTTDKKNYFYFFILEWSGTRTAVINEFGRTCVDLNLMMHSNLTYFDIWTHFSEYSQIQLGHNFMYSVSNSITLR